MKKRKLLLVIASIVILVIMNGCKEDPPEPITGEALFEYVANGYEVTFTNTSTVSGKVTYAWDFGDGKGTSTEKDPVYTYETKGEYTVTLVVTDERGGEHTVSTKIAVAKASPVDLEDDTFDDWDGVTGEGFEVPLADSSGVVKVAKFDYDAEYIYAYVEFEGSVDEQYQYDMFFDTDNSISTGGLTWIWPGSAYDYLFEVAAITPVGGEDQAPGVYEYTGTPGAEEWSWAEKQVADGAYKIGTIAQVGDNVCIEVGFDRSKMPDFQNDIIVIGLMISDVNWTDIGYSPDMGSEAKGFLFDMSK